MQLSSIIKRKIFKTAIIKENKLRNHSIDFFRLLGVFSVILLHIPYSKNLKTIALYLHLGARWAVPFFFFTSGYFFYRNYSLYGDRAILRNLRKLLTIIIFTNIVYLPLMIYWRGWQNIVSIHLIIWGASLHLWFIHALIVGMLFLWLFISSKFHNWILFFGVLILISAYLTGSYSFIINQECDNELSMYLEAVALLILGYKIHILQLLNRKTSIILSVLLIMIGFSIEFIEAIALEKFNNINPHELNFTFGILIYSFGMFILAVNLPITKSIKVAQYGKRYSLSIYLFHPLIILLVTFQIFPVLPFTESLIFSWISPLIYISCCLILITLAHKLYDKLFNK